MTSVPPRRDVNDQHSLGLSSREVDERIARGLVNDSRPVTSRPTRFIVGDNVFTYFNAVLTVCFVAVVVFGDVRDAFFFGLVVANTLIGVIGELRAKRALDRLALSSPARVAARRDGVVVELAPRDLVLDDVVVLRPGDQVPADAVVVESTRLAIDESLITGEAEAVPKFEGDTVLSGSTVAAGTGHARLTAVGGDAYAHRLTAEIRRHSLAHSELRAATTRVLVLLTWVLPPVFALVVASRLVTYSRPEGFDWSAAVIDTVTSVVGMIPEGLVLLVSVSFGLAAVRLARRRVLVNELSAVEVLARVDTLCLDKTGTITTGVIEFLGATPIDPAIDESASRAVLAAIGDDDAANATALALRRALPEPSGLDVVERIPFDSAAGFSGVVLADGATWLLGAPDRVLSNDPAALERARELASAGHRVLALTRGDGRAVALATFGESARGDARATFDYLRDQGIRSLVMSGDDPRTVAAVAAAAGIRGPSVDASALDDDALFDAASTAAVLGRVTPERKRDIVRRLQSAGASVAMTGDGVNDALAVKTADLGIAMGSGSAATRAVARLVLLDGRFAELPRVLALARQSIANVERAANLFLAKTVYGIVFALVFAVLAWEFAFLPRQLTLVSTLTIGIPSLVIAVLPNARRYEPGVLRRMLVYAVLTGGVASVAVIASFGFAREVVALGEARTVATITLFLVSFWILAVLCRPLDRARFALVSAMLAGFAAVLAVPAAREFFALVPVSGAPLVVGVVLGVVGAAGIESVYRVARSRGLVLDRQ